MNDRDRSGDRGDPDDQYGNQALGLILNGVQHLIQTLEENHLHR